MNLAPVYDRYSTERVAGLVRDARRVDAAAYERVRAACCHEDGRFADAHAARVVLTVAQLRQAKETP